MKIITILLTLSFLHAQNDVVKEGIRFYQQKQYEKAKQRFSSQLKSSSKDYAYTMLMMTYYAQKKYQSVKRSYSDYMLTNPASDFIDDAYYIYGKSLFQQKQYKKAIEFSLLALNKTKDKQLTRKSHSLVTEAFDKVSNLSDIIDYQKNIKGERAQAVLAVKAAELEEKNERYINARSILNEFIKNYPKSPFVVVANKGIQRLNSKISNKVFIGILLPFNERPEISNRIFKGIDYALKKAEKRLGIDISLKKEDCGSSVLSAIKAAERLADDRSIISIIGPLNSDQSAAVALLSKQYGIPLLSPTASENGLTDLSKSFYQMNTDDQTIGKFIAEYAFGVLKQRSFAVLSAESGRSANMAKGFVETVERLGGEVISQQIYLDESTVNLRDQFHLIHSAGIKKIFSDSLEMEDPTISSSDIDSLYKERLLDAQELYLKTGKEVDSAKIEVSTIDAIFMPISSTENDRVVDIIARYFATNVFNTKVLGSEQWYNLDIFSNKNLARAFDSLYVFKPFYIDPLKPETRSFINDYRLKEKSTPEYFDYIGYRTARFLFEALRDTENSRESIQRYLSNENDLKVIGGQIDFNHKERVNSGMKILQLRYGKFIDISYN